MDNLDLAIKAAKIRGDITNTGIVDKTKSTETYEWIILRNSAGKKLSKISISRVTELRDQGAKFTDEEQKAVLERVSVTPQQKPKPPASTDAQKVTAIACSLIALIAIGAAINYGYKENEKRKQNDAQSACRLYLTISKASYNRCLGEYGYETRW